MFVHYRFFSSETADNDTSVDDVDSLVDHHEIDTPTSSSVYDTTCVVRTSVVGLRGQAKKRLFESAASKLSRFANTKAKRRRSNDLIVNTPQSKNPFSISAQQTSEHSAREARSTIDLSHDENGCNMDQQDSLNGVDHEISNTSIASSELEDSENGECLNSIAETPNKNSMARISGSCSFSATDHANFPTESSTGREEEGSDPHFGLAVTPPTKPSLLKSLTYPVSIQMVGWRHSVQVYLFSFRSPQGS